MSPNQLTHIALCVSDLERSVSFYKRFANLDLIAQREDNSMRVGWLGNPEVVSCFIIVLLETEYEHPGKGSYHHIGLELDSRDAVDQIASIAKEEGILESEAREHGPDAGYLCVIRDPDGNGVEFSYGQKVLDVLSECPNIQPEKN